MAIQSVVLNHYGGVLHSPPYSLVTEAGKIKQVVDGVGVITRGQGPTPIKENYFLGIVSGEPSFAIYELGVDGISLVHIMMESRRIVIASPEEISIAIGNRKRTNPPTGQEILDALQVIRGFGYVAYPKNFNGTLEGNGKDEVPVSKPIEEMLLSYLKIE